MANNSDNRNGGSNGSRNKNVGPLKPTATSERPVTPIQAGSRPPAPTSPRPSVSSPNGPRRMTPKQEAMLRRQRIRRRNQLIVTSLLVVAVIALVGVIVYVASNSSKVAVDAPISASTADSAPFTTGDPNAKVTLTEWGDFRCIACSNFFQNVEPTIMDNYVKTKKIKFVFKNYITIDPRNTYGDSHRAAEAGWCASDQSHFWDFYQAMYKNYPGETPGYWTADRLKNLASQLKLDTNKFNTCLDSSQHRQDVYAQDQQATQNQFSGTPTLTINDKLITSNYSDVSGISGELDKAIEAAASPTPGAAATTAASTTTGAAVTTNAAGTTTSGAATTAAGAATNAVATTSAVSTTAASATTGAATTISAATTAAGSTPAASPTK